MSEQELSASELAHRWRKRTTLESVDEAVTQAGQTEEYATPDAALRWLLELAWTDLAEARRHSADGTWSIQCDGIVGRIIGLTRLIGPLSWEHVSVDLTLDGVYERIHEAIGMPTPLAPADRQRAQAVRERSKAGGVA
jgi:hypothetical protein